MLSLFSSIESNLLFPSIIAICEHDFFVFPACLVSSFIQYNTYIESYDQSMLIMFSFAIKNPYYIFSHLRLFFEFDFLFQYFQDTQSAAAISLVKFPHL